MKHEGKDYISLKEAKKVKKEIWPPANLPIGEFDEREFSKIQLSKAKEPVLGFRFVFTTVLVFVLLIAGGVFARESLKEVFRTVNSYVKTLNQEVDRSISLTIVSYQDISKEYSYWLSDTVETGISAFADGVYEFSQNVVEGIKSLK